uniref:Uncharacterized protein n=1 Tax=Oryza brachyantha TaxID=4533 RepID=J3MJN6_ORYBR
MEDGANVNHHRDSVWASRLAQPALELDAVVDTPHQSSNLEWSSILHTPIRATKEEPCRHVADAESQDFWRQAMVEEMKSIEAGYVSRFMEKPTTKHWAAMKHILRYVAGTLNRGIQFRKKQMQASRLVCFSDSDMAGDTLIQTIGKVQLEFYSS